MGNLRKGRTLRKTSTLVELHLRCNDFGKLRIKVILSEAGIPYGFHKDVFSYHTEDALAAIYRCRKAAGKKRRTRMESKLRRQMESDMRAYSENLRALHAADHAKIKNAMSSKKWKC